MSLSELLNSGFPKEVLVMIIAALPIFELRGALPVAINLFHFPWYYAFTLAIIGNMLPVPFILLFLNALSRLSCKIGALDRMFQWLCERTRQRGKVIERYEIIGLALFVAVPLPVTGAWTGALAAVLFRLKFKHAFLSILAGVVIAGAIVTSLCLLGWVGAIIAGIGLSILAVFGLWKASAKD